MSPITAAARERLDQYLHDHPLPERRTELALRRLIDDIIAAVRAEQPTDNAF